MADKPDCTEVVIPDMPDDVLKEIDRIAEVQQRTRAAQICIFLAEAVQRQKVLKEPISA